jgi:hypothetical protein
MFYFLFCFYSFKIAKDRAVSKQKYFQMSLIWGAVLTLFSIFSGIFLLVAVFSIITQEWNASFLWTKIPIFIGTFISLKIFVLFKKNSSQ